MPYKILNLITYAYYARKISSVSKEAVFPPRSVESRISIKDYVKVYLFEALYNFGLDLKVSEIDPNMKMKVEYIKPLRDGHQIRIILPSILTFTLTNDFFYEIPGLTYGRDFNAPSRPSRGRNNNEFIADVTFQQDVDDSFPLTVHLRDMNSIILSGNIILPSVSVISDEFVQGFSTAMSATTITLLSLGAASAVTMSLVGSAAPIWGFLDILHY